MGAGPPSVYDGDILAPFTPHPQPQLRGPALLRRGVGKGCPDHREPGLEAARDIINDFLFILDHNLPQEESSWQLRETLKYREQKGFRGLAGLGSIVPLPYSSRVTLGRSPPCSELP